MKNLQDTVTLIDKEYNKKFVEYIREGVKKYKGRFPDPFLPPTIVSLPQIFINNPIINKRVVDFYYGKIKIHEGSPEYKLVLKTLKQLSKTNTGKIKILDIGCGDCGLANYLEACKVNFSYEGVDVSKIESSYRIYSDLSEINSANKYDLVIMIHVAEHMHYNEYYANFQKKIRLLLKKEGLFIFATPNPVCLIAQSMDITHIQIYPWHQTYALLRMNFENISVYRGVHITKILTLVFYLPKIFLCKLIGIDYAGSYIYIIK